MSEISNSSALRIANFFLGFSVLLISLIIFLLFYIYNSSVANDQLRSGLLNQHELQAELLNAQSSDFAVYPHMTKDIGFVLNPYLKSSTWKAAEGESYQINNIGLRGPDIQLKKTGTKRILLVGDSVIFGWKLPEKHKISSQMQAIAKKHFPDESIEFFTVALPGWNKIDEYNFLVSHLEILSPDAVIWSLLRNDIDDTGSPIPPGHLASWNSTQRLRNVSFHTGSQYQKDLPMPAILDRWDANINYISQFDEKYQIPVSLLWWWGGEQRAFFDELLDRNNFQLPYTVVPSSYFDDKEFFCIAKNDCHPTKEATEVIALGLWDLLARNQILPSFSGNQFEAMTIEKFRNQEQAVTNAEERSVFFGSLREQVPEKYDANDEATYPSILFGVKKGQMSQRGVLYLSDKGKNSKKIVMNISPLESSFEYDRNLEVTIRNRKGVEVTSKHQVEGATLILQLKLPIENDFSVYEIEWVFDYSVCDGPATCVSARLEDARFQ